jgi:predicted nucleic acid-binding protein
VIVLDTSVLYALLDGRDERHQEAATWYGKSTEELATTPLVLAEVDHLAAAWAGRGAVAAFRHDAGAGAYTVEWWSSATRDAVEVAERYEDLGASLTDASLVALAARLGTVAVATFDERHFRAMRPVAGGQAFHLLPLDEA